MRVLIATKAPAPGRSKTRLLPALSPEQAARLHEALLLDVVDCARREATVGLLAPAAEDVASLQTLVPGAEVVVQVGSGFADGLFHAMAAATAAEPVAVVSADTPGLPPSELTAAAAALRGGADVALGPTTDGGYWFVAMARQHPAPFRDIPWSTPDCLPVTLERCREASLAVHLAASWRDVDVADDLAWLREHVDSALAPRTAALLPAL
jgi:rSAM/selenodomain-associated transferase 1